MTTCTCTCACTHSLHSLALCAHSLSADRPPSSSLYLIFKGFAQYIDQVMPGANSPLSRALGPSDSWGADDMVLAHRAIYYRFRVTAITYLHVQASQPKASQPGQLPHLANGCHPCRCRCRCLPCPARYCSLLPAPPAHPLACSACPRAPSTSWRRNSRRRSSACASEC